MSYAAIARRIARACGRPASLMAAAAFILIWGITGPLFGWSDTWQLVANTTTSIVTFLMVFLIQNSQDHDTAAVQMKLDELIRASKGAHNALLDLEELDEAALATLRAHYLHLAQEARARGGRGLTDPAPEGLAPGKGADLVHDGAHAARHGGRDGHP